MIKGKKCSELFSDKKNLKATLKDKQILELDSVIISIMQKNVPSKNSFVCLNTKCLPSANSKQFVTINVASSDTKI